MIDTLKRFEQRHIPSVQEITAWVVGFVGVASAPEELVAPPSVEAYHALRTEEELAQTYAEVDATWQRIIAEAETRDRHAHGKPLMPEGF